MSTIDTVQAPRNTTTAGGSAYRLSFAHLVRSEWIKFTTVRSTWWSICLVTVLSAGLSALMASAIASFGGEASASVVASNNAAVQAIVFSTILTQLLAVILGAITVTGEYSTGMIRSTLTAAPRRFGSLLAKALVVGVAMFITGLISFAISVAVTAPILGDASLDFSDLSSSLMPLLGAALYLGLISILGVGIGFVIRNGPGALAIGIGLVFVAPILFLFFPRADSYAWIQTIASYAPSNAGQSLFMGSGMSGNALETWPAIATLIAWALLALVGGAAVLRMRDA
ncbi:ABC-2 type transport system permease protein [Microbacterium halimionae]|uniref:ABC-2 type transport system permease protein n=1 Tax=Microbacterium halimionae TaxID=1526413 RepID=A0A7W3JN59_9MICO|nr:ABC transporter permease [Microbacterium halimionae]MBA8815949.1 ABC-2 type transport system permease protein [Microbacterium halimionae]NII96152.1 ABC-2 type transport system permease protein [Microbacterium halimionae]